MDIALSTILPFLGLTNAYLLYDLNVANLGCSKGPKLTWDNQREKKIGGHNELVSNVTHLYIQAYCLIFLVS